MNLRARRISVDCGVVGWDPTISPIAKTKEEDCCVDQIVVVVVVVDAGDDAQLAIVSVDSVPCKLMRDPHLSYEVEPSVAPRLVVHLLGCVGFDCGFGSDCDWAVEWVDFDY